MQSLVLGTNNAFTKNQKRQMCEHFGTGIELPKTLNSPICEHVNVYIHCPKPWTIKYVNMLISTWHYPKPRTVKLWIYCRLHSLPQTLNRLICEHVEIYIAFCQNKTNSPSTHLAAAKSFSKLSPRQCEGLKITWLDKTASALHFP